MWWKSRRLHRLESGIAVLVTGLVHVAAFRLWDDELRFLHGVESDGGFTIEVVFYTDPLPANSTSSTIPRQKSVEKPRASSDVASSDVESSMAPGPAPTDWHGAASSAAAAVVARSLNPPPLDSKPKTIPKPEIYEKGLFDRGPAHIPGTVEHLGGSDFRTWVTSYCYVLSGMGPLGREEKGGCQRSRAEEGGGELFKELTPKYLKEPPAGKNGLP